MRMSRGKRSVETIELPDQTIEVSIDGRKRELGVLIQAALKVGADLQARETGRRAFAELVKLDRDLAPPQLAPMAPASELIFAVGQKRRRPRPGV